MTQQRLPEPSTSVPAEPKQQPATIRQYLQSDDLKQQIAAALPEHCSADRMMRVAMTALGRIPKLADCDQRSFFQSLLTLSQWGLEPDGRRAHLIPFRNAKLGITECQLIIDYKGLVELAYRSGVVLNIQADVVREGDLFEYDRGRVLKHVPWIARKPDERPEKQGDIFAVYAFVELKGGAEKAELMSREDVEAIRKRSKAGTKGPWVTDWNEMAKKTAFRRVSKWLPLSADVRDAIYSDDDVIDAESFRRHNNKAKISKVTHLLDEESFVGVESESDHSVQD